MKLSSYRSKIARRNPEAVRQVARDIAFKIGLLIMHIRLKHGLTQEQLAKKIGTKQPSIARAEAGYHISTALLQKIADKFDLIIKIHL